jgi:sugar phosphate isomerase/epimerase
MKVEVITHSQMNNVTKIRKRAECIGAQKTLETFTGLALSERVVRISPIPMKPKIAAFPKCYLEQIAGSRSMSVFDWIEMAGSLDADGLEMYDGFFTSLDDAYIDSVGEAIRSAGFAMPMLCCSPDFTQPDPADRQRAVEHESEMIRITRRLGGPCSVCRVLSGQRRPEVRIEEGIEWVVNCIQQLLPVAREYDVILGMENHYKDGYWKYPEFAQKLDVFLEIVNRIDSPHFGVNYDPSNAIVAGEDPFVVLDAVKNRVVSMHASDRYLVSGSLDDPKTQDGTIGYSNNLRHGVIGQGLNDYDRIFSTLREAGFDGWISIEDGENGMEELKQSVHFLREKIKTHWENDHGTAQ